MNFRSRAGISAGRPATCARGQASHEQIFNPFFRWGVGLPGCQMLSAQEMPVEDIVKRANGAAYYAGKDGSADITMTITDAQGRF